MVNLMYQIEVLEGRKTLYWNELTQEFQSQANKATAFFGIDSNYMFEDPEQGTLLDGCLFDRLSTELQRAKQFLMEHGSPNKPFIASYTIRYCRDLSEEALKDFAGVKRV